MWNLLEWRYSLQERPKKHYLGGGVRKAAEGKRNDVVLQFEVVKGKSICSSDFNAMSY